MAFVEFEEVQDMYTTLALHHTLLHGRRINVEKTCGGRNQELRALKIRKLRTDQKIAVSEGIDRLLASYEQQGVVPVRSIGDKLKNRLYALTPAVVTEVRLDLEFFSPLC